MARFEVTFRPRAMKALASLEAGMQARIRQEIDRLADEPRHPGIKKLAGETNEYRARVGDYRIVYEIHDEQLRVLVVEIGDAIRFTDGDSDGAGPRVPQMAKNPPTRRVGRRLARPQGWWRVVGPSGRRYRSRSLQPGVSRRDCDDQAARRHAGVGGQPPAGHLGPAGEPGAVDDSD